MLTGVDLSSYQSSIPSGQDFVLLKATEGLTINDSHFVAWWNSSRGKRRGAYHFGHPRNNAVAEADHFLSVVAARVIPGDLLVLDHEVSDGKSPAQCATWAQTFCGRVTAETGLIPAVYTFLSFAWEGRCAGLGGYPLWIADPSRAAGKPRVPAPWKDWVLHQYSEAGGIDRNVFNGTAADWDALTSGGWMEAMVKALPTLKAGDTGEAVDTLQGLLLARSHSEVAVTGTFDAVTDTAVKAVQTWGKVAADGVVGPKTWPVLLRVN